MVEKEKPAHANKSCAGDIVKKKIAIASAILIVTIVVILFYTNFSSNPNKFTPASTPPLQYTCSFSPSGGVIANASRGSTQQINVTLTSMTGQQILVPVEDLKMTYYSPTVDLNNWIDTSNDSYPALQAEAFNYSFSLSQLSLNPEMSNSTILTINVADNAPLGEYFFSIDFGTIIGSNYPYSSTEDVGIVVIPNTVQLSPSPSPLIAPTLTLQPSATVAVTPQSTAEFTATANPSPISVTITYSEVNRTFIGDETVIAINWEIVNPSSVGGVGFQPYQFYLKDQGTKISADPIVVLYEENRQYPLLEFTIEGIYNGTSYQLENDFVTLVRNNLPVAVNWVKQ